MTVTPRSPRQRNPVLGQLPPITRADGSPIRVLLVDDEPALTNLLKMALHYEGWHIEVARDGREALTKFEEFGPDLLVLDLMLPDIDGLEVLKTIRELEGYTPTLMLTARDSVMDRVTGLTAGADDYLTKPFSMRELLARVKALLRRVELIREELAAQPEVGRPALDTPPRETLVFGNLAIDETRREVRIDGRPIRVKPKEFDLLIFLARHRGIALHCHCSFGHRPAPKA